MKRRTLFVSLVALLGATVAVPTLSAVPAPDAGLVAVQARDLDQLYLRPAVDLAGYHQVLIEPARIAFRNDFNKNRQDALGFTRRLSADEVQRIADDTAASLQEAVAQAFTARGYQIATAPGPGVLRLSPSVVDLFVNAPDARPGGQFKSFTQRDDGEATMVLEARDAVSGTLLGHVVDHRHADKVTPAVTRTTSVEENYWFENMFRAWATSCAKEFEATNPARLSYQTH